MKLRYRILLTLAVVLILSVSVPLPSLRAAPNKTSGGKYFYCGFENGLEGFCFQYASDGAVYKGPEVVGSFAASPHCLFFEVDKNTASFRSPIFRMTKGEMQAYRVVSFWLKADVPPGGRIRVVVWIRGKSAAEQGIPFHIAGTCRELLRIESPVDWSYFQLDVWSAVKDWEGLEDENEWYIECYLDSPGQPVKVWLDDFAVHLKFKIDEPPAYGVVVEVKTTSDWTTVELSGGYLAYYAYEVMEGENAPDLHVTVDSKTIHIGKKSFDRTPVKVKVCGYLVFTSDTLKVTVKKGDIGKTTVKIYAMWGDVEKLVWTFTNKGRVWGSHGLNPRTGTLSKSSFEDSLKQKIVVKNPFGASHYTVTIYYDDGGTETRSSSGSEYTITVTKPISKIVFTYKYNSPSVQVFYTVIPVHTATIHLLVFPSWFRNVSPEDNPTAGQAIVKAYSWYDYDLDSPPGPAWTGAPRYLEEMVGTEMAYVEEDAAGRIFTIFYGFVYSKVKDILDRIGVQDERTRYEIAATALWAAQLVREVKNLSPDRDLCSKATEAILKRYFGFNDFEADIARLILSYYWYRVRRVDKATLYKSVLAAVKSNTDYIKAFPEWNKVDENTWVEICTRLEQYTADYPVPSYAHALIAAAYFLYSVYNIFG